ncbi:MAG TPA: cytochrome c [Gemmatimonadales bacterium]|jgi:cytochrome c6
MSKQSWTRAALVVGALLAVALPAARLEAQEPDGAALYKQHCRSCHGALGVPSQRMVTLYPKLKSLADSAYLASLSTDSIAVVTRNGMGDMKAYADKLSASEIAAVARFVKTLADTTARRP